MLPNREIGICSSLTGTELLLLESIMDRGINITLLPFTCPSGVATSCFWNEITNAFFPDVPKSFGRRFVTSLVTEQREMWGKRDNMGRGTTWDIAQKVGTYVDTMRVMAKQFHLTFSSDQRQRYRYIYIISVLFYIHYTTHLGHFVV